MNNLDQLINLKVKITNLLDETTTATIYAVSPSHEVLALRISPPNGGKGAKLDQMKIINTAFIKSLQVLPPFPKKGHKPYNVYHPKFARIDLKKFETDLDKAVDQYKTLPKPQTQAQRKSEFQSHKKSDLKVESKTEQKSDLKTEQKFEPQASKKSEQVSKSSEPQPHKKTEASPMATKIFNKLSSKLGKENVQWTGNEAIVAFKDINIVRPYALNRISRNPKSKAPSHLMEVKAALKESWLEVDSAKRGG